MQKKGQLTTFVLVAFVVIILVVVLTLMYVFLIKVSISDKQYTIDKTNEVKQYIQDCVTTWLISGLKDNGLDDIGSYMKNIDCMEFVGRVSGIRIDSNNADIETTVNDESINIDYQQDISLVKEGLDSKIGKLSYAYPIYSSLNVDSDNDNKADNDFDARAAADLASLVILKGTSVGIDIIEIGVERKTDERQFSDTIVARPNTEFEPRAFLSIYYDVCDESITIIDKSSLTAIESDCITLEDDTYVVAEIDKTGEYFVGSCDDFACGWVADEVPGEGPEDEEAGLAEDSVTGQGTGGIDCDDPNIYVKNPCCKQGTC